MLQQLVEVFAVTQLLFDSQKSFSGSFLMVLVDGFIFPLFD
jgi:hypothetical protein